MRRGRGRRGAASRGAGSGEERPRSGRPLEPLRCAGVRAGPPRAPNCRAHEGAEDA